jgi:hypothetical protein
MNATRTAGAIPSLESSVMVSDDLIVRELDGEAVILNLTSGLYFSLNPVGTRVWHLCNEHRSVHAIWEGLQREFDAPPETLRTDLLALLGDLAENELITIQ